MKFIVQDLIDKDLEREPYDGSGKIIASALGRCYRFQFWQRKNERQTNPPDRRAVRVFKAGDLFHEFVQRILEKHGYITELTNKDKCTIETEDIKLRVDAFNDDEVLDLKSQHSRGFWHLQKAKTDIRSARYTNWLQIMLGCEMFQKKQGRLVIISKDDLCIAEYLQPYDKFWQDAIKEELEMLRMIWRRQELPLAQPRAYNGKECTYCPYKNRCKQIEKDKIDAK